MAKALAPVEAELVLNELERLTAQVRTLVLKEPELREPVRFVVWPDESDPHECGPLRVEIDQNGVRLWWLGTENEPPESELGWRDLRHFAELERDIPALEAEREDLLREVDLYRRTGYRYRHAMRSMQRKYEEFARTLPPDMPRISVEAP